VDDRARARLGAHAVNQRTGGLQTERRKLAFWSTEYGAALTYDDPWTLIHNRLLKAPRRVFHAEGVRSAASTFGSGAGFVFPVFQPQEWDINPPDRNDFATL